MISCLEPNSTAIPPPQYTSSEWLAPPPMVNASETDATGVPWLLSPEWTPGKPTGRGRRLAIPPNEALAEIHYIFSRLYHSFCDSLPLDTPALSHEGDGGSDEIQQPPEHPSPPSTPLKFKDDEPVMDWAYVEMRHYMMKLQALWDELNALKVSSGDEKDKHALVMTMRGATLKVEGDVKQKRALALSHEEYSKIYRRVQAEQRARKPQKTELGCIIS